MAIEPTPTPSQLRRLAHTQEARHVPPQDRQWFWKTFKELKKTGYPYTKAWDYTCWALEVSYGIDFAQ